MTLKRRQPAGVAAAGVLTGLLVSALVLPGCTRPGVVFELKEPFAEPESVLYEPTADVYLVSNVAGGPLAHDGNGFITRLTPDGKVQSAHWIASGAKGAVLDAPKGMASSGDALFVADIDKVRVFALSDGAPRQVIPIAAAKFLNDVVVIATDEVLVSDTVTNRIHRVRSDGAVSLFAEDPAFAGANGLALDSKHGRILVLSGDGDTLSLLDLSGKLIQRSKLGVSKLDGIVVTASGRSYVSSWTSSAVYELDAFQKPKLLFDDLTSPADIGWDSRRQRLLVPLMQRSELIVLSTRDEKAP